ncbi:hypothetical protein HZS_2018 [Henneguya salminicola]|nr:hypothetical protein HZS_2018 [Henneguya salminicola]
MDIIENTAQSVLIESIVQEGKNLNADILSNTSEKAVYQKFESSVSEIKEIKLERNNSLEYVENKNENPCNLILTQILSRSAVSTPRDTTGILAKSQSFLSYIILNQNSAFELVKIVHLESREYTTIKSLNGLVVSISLNDYDLLAALNDSFLLTIYKITFVENKRLNLTWNNTGQDKKSIILWAKDSVLTVDIKKTETNYEIQNENDIQSFNNVLTACMSSNSFFIAVACENNSVAVCHRINDNSKFENYFSRTENITNEQIFSLKMLEEDTQTGSPLTLIALWPSHIILLLIKLNLCKSSIPASHLICYPFESKTLSFASDTVPTDSGVVLLYDYHNRHNFNIIISVECKFIKFPFKKID